MTQRPTRIVTDVMVCYACRARIHYGTTMYPALRAVPKNSVPARRLEEDYIVKCPRAGDSTMHPEGSGWNWASMAVVRGRELAMVLRARAADAAAAAKRLREVKA